MNKIQIVRCVLLVACAALQPLFAQEVKGNPAAGEKKVAQCIGCHGIKGYRASFPEIYRVPMIFGQTEKYLVSALGGYKRGERRHPTMRGVVDNLSDQDIADLAAYYASTKTPSHAPSASGNAVDSQAAMALVQKGGCVACHGESFNKPVDPAYPKVAGQYADYLAVALKSYKMEGGTVVGRSNPIMGGMVKQFSNDELRLIARYVASLPGDLETIPQSKFR